MRLPEIGLLLEPEDTCIRQRPTGQRRLAMVSGGMACTLHQFLKLTPNDVIELQLLCYFPRNIEGGASAGHFGPSLATTECPLGSGSKN
jgi:hypothetical protein